ncbi:MAG TPA: hypothetical protein VGB79_10305 [Allosphingosinicella sp.]|jgi:hypothetical protein
MSGYQFVRMDTYAMAVPKLRAQFETKRRELGREVERKLTVEEICAEAARVPGNHQHIVEPEAAVMLFGLAPEDIPAWLQGRIDEKNAEIAAEKRAMPRGARRGGPRAIRSDSPVLIAVVGSHPFFMKGDGTDYPSLDDPQCRAAVEMWKAGWVEWKLKEAAARGAQVISIVEHVDEGHPHLHAFEIADNPRLDARAAHPGFAAKRAVTPIDGEDEKATAKRANTAYKDAMMRWQDEHHARVSVDHGLLRIGPRRRRLGRAPYQQEKKAADGLARMRAAERDEKERFDRAAEERAAEELALRARLQELEALAVAQEGRAQEAGRNAETAGVLAEKAIERVIGASERKRQIERDANDAEERLRGAAELETSMKKRLQCEEVALAVAEKTRREAEAKQQELIAALEDVEARSRRLGERLEKQSGEEKRLNGELKRLQMAAEQQERTLADQNSAFEIARANLETREEAVIEREDRLRAQEKNYCERQALLDGKLIGLDAYFANEIGVREQPTLQLYPRTQDRALIARIKPAADWLAQRLLPLSRAWALGEALKAWAKGWLANPIVGMPGRQSLRATPDLPAEVKSLVVAHHDYLAEMLAPLPDVLAIVSIAEQAKLLQPHLLEADAARARQLTIEIEDDTHLAALSRWRERGGRGS